MKVKFTFHAGFIILFILGLFSACGQLGELVGVEPKGSCVYGPPGYRVCITGTYEGECTNNYLNGTWSKDGGC